MAGGGSHRLASVADHHAFPIDEHRGPRKRRHRQHRGPGLGADCRARRPTTYLAVSTTRPAGDPAALRRRREHVRGNSRFPAGRQAASGRTFQPRAAKTTRTARAAKTTERPSQPPPVVSVPFTNMLSTARPEEVWAAIRECQGEPFTVDELQTKLGAGVGPYVMMWARDGFLIKADRDASPGASWRYRLLRDDPEHPPVG